MNGRSSSEAACVQRFFPGFIGLHGFAGRLLGYGVLYQ